MFVFSGWLDDIGLPQYKDHFHDAIVDGRMLNHLSVVSLTQLLSRDVTCASQMFLNSCLFAGGSVALESDEPDAPFEY